MPVKALPLTWITSWILFVFIIFVIWMSGKTFRCIHITETRRFYARGALTFLWNTRTSRALQLLSLIYEKKLHLLFVKDFLLRKNIKCPTSATTLKQLMRILPVFLDMPQLFQNMCLGYREYLHI